MFNDAHGPVDDASGRCERRRPNSAQRPSEHHCSRRRYSKHTGSFPTSTSSAASGTSRHQPSPSSSSRRLMSTSSVRRRPRPRWRSASVGRTRAISAANRCGTSGTVRPKKVRRTARVTHACSRSFGPVAGSADRAGPSRRRRESLAASPASKLLRRTFKVLVPTPAVPGHRSVLPAKSHGCERDR